MTTLHKPVLLKETLALWHGREGGFYVDATTEKWKKHFQMFSYVTKELPLIINENFPVDKERESISGHSMGGHGALMISLRQPGRFRSVSAFAPISAPSHCPWGKKAFTTFLGSDEEAWKAYDTCHLVQRASKPLRFLVDQGTDDKWVSQLMPEKLQDVCLRADYPLELNLREGYDHGYYFVSSFIESHLAYHAKALGA